MANARKINNTATDEHDSMDGFPPEAFAYDDDVTPEAVNKMRSKAAAVIDAEQWIVIDGYGPNHPAQLG